MKKHMVSTNFKIFLYRTFYKECFYEDTSLL